MSLAQRLAGRMKEKNVSQAELGRRVGLSQPSISAIYNGDTQKPKDLRAIALALDTTEAWLLGETDDPSAGALSALDREEMADRLGQYLVPTHDTGWALGEGTFLDIIEQTGFRAFDQQWLRKISSGNLAKLFVAHGDGDSMEPTIHDGDIVLVDRAQNAIDRHDRIWALVIGGLGTIKRVNKMPDGRFELVGDNPNIRSRVVNGEELHVVGRVIWIGRRI